MDAPRPSSAGNDVERAPEERPADERLIGLLAAWKAVKSAALLIVAAALGWPAGSGVQFAHDVAHRVADTLATAVGSAWVADFGAWLDAHITPAHVQLSALLAAGGAAVLALEAVGLHLRRRWAAWLTVGVTAALIPVELWELARRPRPAGVGVLIANVAIVAWLTRKARRDRSIWKG